MLPTTPYTAVPACTVRKRNSPTILDAGTWPGAAPSPAYDHRDPKCAARSRLGKPVPPMAMTIACPGAATSRSTARSRRPDGITASLTREVPSDRIARACTMRSGGTPLKSCIESTTRSACARTSGSKPARHSISTYSAPRSNASCSTDRLVSSGPSNRPPSQTGRHVTTTGCRRSFRAPATSKSATPSSRNSTRSQSQHASRAARSSAIERPVTVSQISGCINLVPTPESTCGASPCTGRK